MSQYPSPYTPPSAAHAGSQDYLAPSRRAGVLLYVIGGLTLLLSTCNTISFMVTPSDQLMQQMQQQAAATGQPVPFSAETLRVMGMIGLAIVIAFGAALVMLGTGVRRGGKGSTIGALVMAGIALMCLAVVLLVSLVGATQNPMFIALACTGMIPAALYGLLAFWLIGALRSLSKFGMTQQQYAAQYWQYQQNMQAYAYAAQQQGYAQQGYATAPAPVPQLTPPPPPPPATTPIETDNPPPPV